MALRPFILRVLLVALLLMQAAMPRERVLCLQADGDWAIEVAHAGRCLSSADCSSLDSAAEQGASTYLQSADDSCTDLPVGHLELRSASRQRVAAEPASFEQGCGQPASLSLAWITPRTALSPARPIHLCTARPAYRVASTVLRI